jgi:hypothetical protein
MISYKKMVLIPKNATNEEVLDIIRKWVGVLATEDYEAVVRELGYLVSYSSSPAERTEDLRIQIKRYVSPEYFPGVTDFVVTDWRTAQGGNPKPLSTVTWYKPNSGGLRGAVEFDLPLNGKWSDLTADFVFFENNNQGYSLALEEIFSRKQRLRESENL